MIKLICHQFRPSYIFQAEIEIHAVQSSSDESNPDEPELSSDDTNIDHDDGPENFEPNAPPMPQDVEIEIAPVPQNNEVLYPRVPNAQGE